MFVKKKNPFTKKLVWEKNSSELQTFLSESSCSNSWGLLFRSQGSVLTASIPFQNCLMAFRMCSLLSLVSFRCQCLPFDFCYSVHSCTMGLDKTRARAVQLFCKILLDQRRTLSPHGNFMITLFLIEPLCYSWKRNLCIPFIWVLFWIEPVC